MTMKYFACPNLPDIFESSWSPADETKNFAMTDSFLIWVFKKQYKYNENILIMQFIWIKFVDFDLGAINLIKLASKVSFNM